MRDVKLSKWAQIAGRIAGWLVLASAAQVILLPLVGSITPGNGDFSLILSRKTIYVDIFEYAAFLSSVIGALVLGLIYLISYFSARSRGSAG